MNYDPDSIDKLFDYYGDYESEWENYKTKYFATKQKVDRVSELMKFDSLMGEPKPNRGYASMLNKKRQLEDIHWALDRIGK